VYQLPTRAVTFMRAQTGSSVVFGVRNIHTWTKFTGPDPEANAGTTNEGQFEFNTAPLPTYFTLRLNLKY
jgi:hypothetical protein